MAFCKKCGTENPSDFAKGGRSNHGVQPLCRSCTKPRQSLLRGLRNREKVALFIKKEKESGQLNMFAVNQ